MGTGELLGKRNKLRESDLRWTSIPSRGSRNTRSRFMLCEPDDFKASLFTEVEVNSDGYLLNREA